MMVCSIIDQNWVKSNSGHKFWYQVFDVSNLLSISVNFTLRCARCFAQPPLLLTVFTADTPG